jgi:hypothetical protein
MNKYKKLVLKNPKFWSSSGPQSLYSKTHPLSMVGINRDING